MAWPVGMELPTLGPMAFFLAAAVWFVLVAAHVFSGDDGRLTNGYHANMMAAVAWLYAVMRGGPLGRRDHPPDHTMPSSPGMKMPGMDISVPHTAEPWWITTLNWIAAVGFASAAGVLHIAGRRTAGRKEPRGPAVRAERGQLPAAVSTAAALDSRWAAGSAGPARTEDSEARGPATGESEAVPRAG